MNLLTNTSGAPRSGGVYCVTNLLDGRMYVGQSSHVRNRLNSHKKAGFITDLGTDVRRFGPENFRWEVLHSSESLSERHRLEVFWIAEKGSVENGYNKATGGPGPSGNKMTDEAKLRISVALSGRSVSEATKEKHRVASTGFRHSEATKALLSQRRVGVPLKVETVEKMSKARRGNLNPRARRVRLSVENLTVEFGTVGELSTYLDVSRLTVSGWLRAGLPEGLLQVANGKIVRVAWRATNATRDKSALCYTD